MSADPFDPGRDRLRGDPALERRERALEEARDRLEFVDPDHQDFEDDLRGIRLRQETIDLETRHRAAAELAQQFRHVTPTVEDIVLDEDGVPRPTDAIVEAERRARERAARRAAEAAREEALAEAEAAEAAAREAFVEDHADDLRTVDDPDPFDDVVIDDDTLRFREEIIEEEEALDLELQQQDFAADLAEEFDHVDPDPDRHVEFDTIVDDGEERDVLVATDALFREEAAAELGVDPDEVIETDDGFGVRVTVPDIEAETDFIRQVQHHAQMAPDAIPDFEAETDFLRQVTPALHQPTQPVTDATTPVDSDPVAQLDELGGLVQAEEARRAEIRSLSAPLIEAAELDAATDFDHQLAMHHAIEQPAARARRDFDFAIDDVADQLEVDRAAIDVDVADETLGIDTATAGLDATADTVEFDLFTGEPLDDEMIVEPAPHPLSGIPGAGVAAAAIPDPVMDLSDRLRTAELRGHLREEALTDAMRTGVFDVGREIETFAFGPEGAGIRDDIATAREVFADTPAVARETGQDVATLLAMPPAVVGAHVATGVDRVIPDRAHVAAREFTETTFDEFVDPTIDVVADRAPSPGILAAPALPAIVAGQQAREILDQGVTTVRDFEAPASTAEMLGATPMGHRLDETDQAFAEEDFHEPAVDTAVTTGELLAGTPTGQRLTDTIDTAQDPAFQTELRAFASAGVETATDIHERTRPIRAAALLQDEDPDVMAEEFDDLVIGEVPVGAGRRGALRVPAQARDLGTVSPRVDRRTLDLFTGAAAGAFTFEQLRERLDEDEEELPPEQFFAPEQEIPTEDVLTDEVPIPETPPMHRPDVPAVDVDRTEIPIGERLFFDEPDIPIPAEDDPALFEAMPQAIIEPELDEEEDREQLIDEFVNGDLVNGHRDEIDEFREFVPQPLPEEIPVDPEPLIDREIDPTVVEEPTVTEFPGTGELFESPLVSDPVDQAIAQQPLEQQVFAPAIERQDVVQRRLLEPDPVTDHFFLDPPVRFDQIQPTDLVDEPAVDTQPSIDTVTATDTAIIQQPRLTPVPLLDPGLDLQEVAIETPTVEHPAVHPPDFGHPHIHGPPHPPRRPPRRPPLRPPWFDLPEEDPDPFEIETGAEDALFETFIADPQDLFGSPVDDGTAFWDGSVADDLGMDGFDTGGFWEGSAAGDPFGAPEWDDGGGWGFGGTDTADALGWDAADVWETETEDLFR